jgi:hypothetical protein
MKKFCIAAGSLTALAFVLAVGLADEKLVSGPQVGQAVPGPFHPLNITGENAGEKQCLFCKNGTKPVAMIFAREMSEPLTQLLKKIDTATAEHKDAKMGSFVVFLNDEEGLASRLKELADREKIQTCVLSIDNPAGPRAYKVAKNADVTVVLYTDHTVKANYAFEKGQMKDKDIDQIVESISKILPNS